MDPKLPGVIAIVFALGGPFLLGIVYFVMNMITKVSQQAADTKLKVEMIRRGFSAAEIERICRLSVSDNTKIPPAPEQEATTWKPVVPPKPAKA